MKLELTLLAKKMTSCVQCEHNGYRYEFSTSIECFCCAQRKCESNGGTLARYLNEDAYLELRKCCQRGFTYWIGLFENRNCSSSQAGPHLPYSWVGYTTCTNGSPLIVETLASGAQNQAVSILLNSNNPTKPPNAKEKYDNEKTRYICQYPLATSTAAASSSFTTISTKDVTSSPIADTITTAESTTITDTTSTSSNTQSQESTLFSSTIAATSSTMTSTTASPDTNVHDPTGLIVGLAVGGILLIIALLVFYLFFYKNGYYKKLKKANRHTTSASFTPTNGKKSNTKEVKENPLYGRYEITDNI